MAQNAHVDDQSIGNDCRLFRRVPVIPNLTVVWDGNLLRWRPSSAAFTDSPDGSPMSVVLGSELEAAAREPASVLVGHDGFALAYITAAAVARQQHQAVVRDALPEEPAHGLVAGAKPRPASRQMAKASIWTVEPQLDPPPA